MQRSKNLEFEFRGKFEIPKVRRDASALTIHPATGHLWTITDDKIRLVEFTNQGRFVREVKLDDFDDAEGLCHVDGDRFLIAEEKKMSITLIDVPAGAAKVTASVKRIPLDVKSKKNKGLEGVSYDARSDTLFAVREDKPPAVFRISPLLANSHPITREWPLDLEAFADLSDTYFEASTGWLWLLSHESQLAAAYDSHGERVTELILKKGHHGLPEDIEQAEGIVRDRDGMLYICSEPNLIYCFRAMGHKQD